MNNEECCERFDPKPWDGKILEWKNKRFIKGRVLTFFFIPLNFGSVINGLMKKISSAKASCKDNMGLSDHTSRWNMDLYIAVDKEIPNANNVTLTGKFFSKVYEGDFKETGKWCSDFKEHAGKKGLEVRKMFMWYTTCPKCAKKYGKNYVVIIAEVQ